MTEVEKWTPVYITTTTPADEAGNLYIPALIPANVTALPARVTDVAPTDDQLAANKPLQFDWLTKTWGESGEDPLAKQLAAMTLQLAKQTAASNADATAYKSQIAAMALKLAQLTAAQKPADDSKPAADTSAPATDTSNKPATDSGTPTPDTSTGNDDDKGATEAPKEA